MKILKAYKYKNKSVFYRVFDDNKVYIIKRDLLYKQMCTGAVKVSNAYIRGTSIVVKDVQVPVKIRNSCLIPILMLKPDAAPLRVDSVFAFSVAPEQLDCTALQLIKSIDKAEPEREVFKYGKFSTKFGVCDIDSLSSGCKVVLLGYLNQKNKEKKVIDITSAGINAIKVFLDYLSTVQDIRIIIGIRGIPEFYNNDIDEGYLFKDMSDGSIKTFLDFLMAHPLEGD